VIFFVFFYFLDFLQLAAELIHLPRMTFGHEIIDLLTKFTPGSSQPGWCLARPGLCPMLGRARLCLGHARPRPALHGPGHRSGPSYDTSDLLQLTKTMYWYIYIYIYIYVAPSPLLSLSLSVSVHLRLCHMIW
jgi:hypothetical protein